MSIPETKKGKRTATSIKIKPKVWKEAKIEAIKQGKTVSELVEEAIEKWIKEHNK
jgi:predicted HicB family RNase H-like nuclease